MSSDKNVLCFQHCDSISIFCKKVPEKCPVCAENLTTQSLVPFVIPYPLVNANDCVCSIIVRPGVKSFLDNYKITDDLHIGITNSSGTVFEYDKCGLVVNDIEKWKDCAAITFIPESWQTFWDDILTNMCNHSIWSRSNYNDVTFNCFDFVIAFLKSLKYKNIQFMNKEDMSEVFILPKIQNILKYATIHQCLKKKDYYIQE